jgi:PST family polysaccharide transporter
MSLRQKAVQGIAWSFIQSYGNQAISLLVFLLLARLLGPEAFGLIALANIFIHFTQIFLDQGLSEAIIQRKDLEPEHLDSAFWSNIGSGALLMSIGMIGAPIMAQVFEEPQLIPVIRALSLTLLIGGLNGVQQAILRRSLAFRIIAIRSLIAALSGAAVAIVMALHGMGVWSLIGLTLTDRVVGAIILWRVNDWRPGFRFSLKHFKDLFRFGVNVVGIVILVFISRRVDDFLIGYFLGPVTLGYYSIAYRVLTIMTQTLCDQPQKVAMPTFSKLQEDLDKFQGAFYKTSQMLSLVTFPLFCGIVVLAPEIVRGVFGRQWEPSIPVLQCLMVAGCLQSLFYFCSPALMAKGKPFWSLTLFFLNTVFSVIGFLSVVHWGIVAVSISLVGVAIAMCPVYLWVLHKQLHIKIIPFLGKYVPALSASLAMVGMITVAKYLFGDALIPLAALAVYGVIGALTYIAATFLVAPILFRQVFGLARSLVSSS